MRKSVWMIVLLGVTMCSAAGVSFAQLRSAAVPLNTCNMPCSPTRNCAAGPCPFCNNPLNDSGRCVATMTPAQ